MAAARSVSSLIVLKDEQLLQGSENYQSWSFLMEGVLFNDGLWDITDNGVTAEEAEAKAKEEDLSKRAMYKIVFNCSPQIQSVVSSLRDGKAVWDKLKLLYGNNSYSSMLGLLQKLFYCKFDEHPHVDSYLNDIMSCQSKLTQMGCGLKDVHVAYLMLIGLPLQYQPLRMTLESLNLELTSDYVRRKLQSFQLETYGNSAMLVRFKGQSGQRGEEHQKNNDRACFHCGGTDHIKRHCKKWKAERKKSTEMKKQKPEKKPNEKLKDKANLVFESEDRCLLSFVEENEESALKVNNGKPWYVDSGASKHMCSEEGLHEGIREVNHSKNIYVANGQAAPVKGVGNVPLELDVGRTMLKDVLYVPGLSTNLISVSAMCDKDLTVTFNKNGCCVTNKKGEVLMNAKRVGGLFQANFSENESGECCKLQALAVKVSPSNQDLWHRRFGHLSLTQMKQIHSKDCSVGSLVDKLCEVCVRGKMVRRPFPPSKSERSTEPLQLIHTDLFGPMKLNSFGGARYTMLLQDDYSKKIFCYFLKEKSEVHTKFIEFKKLVENQTSKTIKIVRSDNGTEYVNQYLGGLFKEAGIIHQTSAPYSPQQNGVSERGNRTVVDMATCMLLDSKRHFRFWAEATACAVYVRNRSPCSVLDGAMPEEVWTGQPVSLNHLKVFGVTALVHIPKEKRKKFEEKAQKMIFVGFCENSKAYKFVEPTNPAGRYVISRDAKFLEDDVSEDALSEETTHSGHPFLEGADYFIDNPDKPAVIPTPVPEPVVPTPEPEPEPTVEPEQHKEGKKNKKPPPKQPTRTSKRIRKAKKNPDFVYSSIDDDDCDNDINGLDFALITSTHPDEPKTYEDAMSRSDASKWKAAMENEMKSHEECGTWSDEEAPPGKRVVSTRWVFKLKRDASGAIVLWKARLVARGFSQVKGEDFHETFSPTIRHSSVRLLFALAAKNDWEIDHVDVKTAFLQGNLDEEVYIRLPDGATHKLKKAIYGLKQASRAWYLTLLKAFRQMKMKRMAKESCIFYRTDGKNVIIFAVYVDDILIFSSCAKATEDAKKELAAKFICKDLGPISSYLGVRVTRNREEGTIHLDQQAYLHDVLEEAGMDDCNASSLPLSPSCKLTKATAAESAKCDKPYQHLVGRLMYLATFTRPDLMHTMSVLSQFNTCYGDKHWGAIRNTLKYLKGTSDYALTYSKSGCDLTGYSDADWANCPMDRRSYTGYTILLGGGAIAWESRKQRSVALSTTEAEFVALTDLAKEAKFLLSLMYHLRCAPKHVPLWCDNAGAVAFSKQERTCGRLKHVDMRYFYIKELIQQQKFQVKHVPTTEMVADVLTKPLKATKHKDCIVKMGLIVP